MKKTLNINIGNSIIHIEEDAYEMLTIYLNEVKHHFAKSADDFEIVTDIENRIAEMFGEILSAQQKQVINIDDVKSVTAQMGSVKDFETSEESEEAVDPLAHIPPYDGIKKLYRDTDQAMVAGVCIGLAHYLNIEAKWIRLAALISVFIGGSGVLAYLIMWIVIPKAESRTEKMTMRGEAPNLKGFANSHLNPLMQQSRGFIAEFFEFLGNFIQGAGKTIFKIIAIGIIVFGCFFLLCLIATLAGFFGIWDSNVYNYFPINVINEEYLSTTVLAAFVVLAVPLLALVLFSIRVAFNGKAINKTLSFGLLIIWLGGVVVGMFYVAKITAEFRQKAEVAQASPLVSYKTLFLTVDKTRFFTKEDSVNYQIDPDNYKGRRILNDDDNGFDELRNVSLRIEKSENGKTELIKSYSAKGRTFEAALAQAQNIRYQFLQKDSLLNFSSHFQLTKKANWRDQEVDLVLNVPVGTHLKINRQLRGFLNGYNYHGCDDYSEMEFSEWIMTDTGLKCSEELNNPDKE